MSSSPQRGAKRTAAKSATKKRTAAQKRQTERAAAGPDDDETPERGSADFQMPPDGHIVWTFGGETYTLEPLDGGQYQELDWRKREGGARALDQLRMAMGMPADTEEQQEAKLRAIRSANVGQSTWVMRWYARLFELAEVDSRAFPYAVFYAGDDGEPVSVDGADDVPEGSELVGMDTQAPAWIFRAGVMDSILDQLVGPAPPGVG